MKLGIGTYTYAWSIGAPNYQPEKPLGALDLLDLATALGVGIVQYGPNLALDQLPETEQRLVIDCAKKRGIALEIGTRGTDPAYLATQVELAREVASPTLRWSVDDGASASVSIDEVEECIRQLMPGLAGAGVRLALENSRIHSGAMAEMLRKLDSPWVGVTLDTVNSLAVPEGSASVIANLTPYIASLHIKDFQVNRMPHRMGFIVEGRPAGGGQLDVPALIATLRAAGVEANAILELWPPEQDNLAKTVALERRWAEESISYLRRYISN
jgi:3-oxoisoapionate decarboxylase